MDTIGYKKLVAWQTAMDLIPDVYALVDRLPKTERFGLADQMRRAVISIAANIAEGHGRAGKKEFAYFLGVSQGSLSELETLIEASLRLNHIGQDMAILPTTKLVRVRKLLFGLQNSLRR